MNTINSYNNTPHFTGYEKTFVMLKPDAFSRHLDEAIMSTINGEKGLKITKIWEGIPERAKLERIWEDKKNKPFFKDWMNYMASGKVRGMVVEGDDAVTRILKIKQTIRNTFAPNEKRKNLVHSSDDCINAEREILNFFA